MLLGRNGVITYRNDEGGGVGSYDHDYDAASELPGGRHNYFLNQQKLLSSSSSSPQIDLDEVMRRNQ